MRTGRPYLFLIFLISFSCTKSHKNLINPLSEKNGISYDSLKKNVFSHYKDKKSLEFKSASFLLENLRYHYTSGNQRSKAYSQVIDQYSKDTLRLSEELKKLRSTDFDLDTIQDIEKLTAPYLISNIKSAVNIYKNSVWGKDVSFDDFCNYILPYRMGYEPLSDWRSYSLKAFFKENDRSIFKKDIYSALNQVHSWLHARKSTFQLKFGYNTLGFPELPPYVLDKLNEGSCHELSYISIAMLRSLGIPATIEFTPVFLNQNSGHEWAAVILKDKDLSFDMTAPILNHRSDFYVPAKVYRQAFSAVEGTHFDLKGYCDYLPKFFNNPFLIDATSSFNTTSDISVPIIADIPDSIDFAYLSVFTTSAWSPVGWGRIKRSEAEFKNFGRGGVYLPVYYRYDYSEPLGPPFILKTDGKVRQLIADTSNTETLKLYRKFPMNDDKITYIKRMTGGKFQGSNFPDFSDAEDLYEIREYPGEHFNIVNLQNAKNYRYIRYYSPKNGHGNLSELSFYEKETDTLELKGKIIGTTGSLKNDSKCTKEAVFDTNPLTYFDTEQADGGWVGMDLGQSRSVKKIRFLARTDMNAIQEDNIYELFYWNGDWLSLGTQVAKTHYLNYDKVPKNALLWLRNLTEGIEERIFTYENGKQVWW